MNKKLLIALFAVVLVGMPMMAMMSDAEFDAMQSRAETMRHEKGTISNFNVDFEKIKNILNPKVAFDNNMQQLRSRLAALETSLEGAVIDDVVNRDVIKHRDSQIKEVEEEMASHQVWAIDKYLRETFTFYANNRMNKNGDQLIKLIREVQKKFVTFPMNSMNTYDKLLAKATIEQFIANLYDAVREDTKYSKHASIKKFGMYRTEPYIKGYHKYYYLPPTKWFGNQPFFSQPATQGWTKTGILLAGAALGAAATAAYYYRKPIGEKAAEFDKYAQEKNTWYKGGREYAGKGYEAAGEYVSPYAKKAGEAISAGYKGAGEFAAGVGAKAKELYGRVRGNKGWSDQYGAYLREKEIDQLVEQQEALQVDADIAAIEKEKQEIQEKENAARKNLRKLNREYETGLTRAWDQRREERNRLKQIAQEEALLKEKEAASREVVRGLNQEFEADLSRDWQQRREEQKRLKQIEQEAALLKEKEAASREVVRGLNQEFEADLSRGWQQRREEQKRLKQIAQEEASLKEKEAAAIERENMIIEDEKQKLEQNKESTLSLLNQMPQGSETVAAQEYLEELNNKISDLDTQQNLLEVAPLGQEIVTTSGSEVSPPETTKKSKKTRRVKKAQKPRKARTHEEIMKTYQKRY